MLGGRLGIGGVTPMTRTGPPVGLGVGGVTGGVTPVARTSFSPPFLHSRPLPPSLPSCLAFMFMHVLVLVVMPPMTSVAC